MSVVTAKKAAKRVKEMEAFRKKLGEDPALRKRFIKMTGIWDQNGKLTKPYR